MSVPTVIHRQLSVTQWILSPAKSEEDISYTLYTRLHILDYVHCEKIIFKWY